MVAAVLMRFLRLEIVFGYKGLYTFPTSFKRRNSQGLCQEIMVAMKLDQHISFNSKVRIYLHKYASSLENHFIKYASSPGNCFIKQSHLMHQL